MATPLLQIEGLKTYFHTDEGVVKAVDDVTLSVEEGQTLGIVGESGSGKSVTALTVMRLLPEGASRIAAGRVSFLGRNLLELSNREMRDLRGCAIGMVFQEPMTSLNPVFRVGDQVAEAILRHRNVSRAEARERTIALFHEVGIPDPESRLDSYPHQMSGGQKQRVMIAMALACDPKLLIADEPTTALDVTIQAQILALLRKLRDKHRMSMIFITHDLGVIAEIADHVAVMYAGKLVECGDVVSVFENPQHPYTRGLLACRPRLDTPYRLLPTVNDFLESWVEDDEVRMLEKSPTEERLSELVAGEECTIITTGEPILSVRNLEVYFQVSSGWMRPKKVIRAVDDISFEVIRGQTLGLVGESGCGKTTAARAILRLVEPTGGVVVFKGKKLHRLSHRQMREVRRDLQMIFQDPYSSLNPRLTIEDAVTEPMIVHGIGTSASDRRDRAAALLDECGLPVEYLRRYPHEFSGGERQRICIARTLSLEPEFIICDESVSSLDVSVQAQVLNLLKRLQANRGLTYIFISHDLSVVKFMSDVLAVMKDGKILEIGPAEELYLYPQEPYTQTLIDAIPKDDLDHIRMRQADRRRAAMTKRDASAPCPGASSPQ
ncbi:MAG: ABC transporter ATP-binding protein [Deltaproteobacteria bacterium]|nr:ABC transporter ATP-binding protein [Deltaproteobacteria bacterium]MBW2253525.1 ABC transporter ATP-binding protein [Deltaproteobacteria bacterium]